MSQLHGADLALMAIILVVSPAIDLMLFPRLVRAAPDSADGIRQRFYAAVLFTSWLITAAIGALWVRYERDRATIGLGIGSPVGLAIASAVVLGLIWFLVAQSCRLADRPERLISVSRRLGRAGAMVPRTALQWRMFVAVSLTAGFCEEVMFRGYVTWCLGHWTGPVVTLLGSSLLFGLVHGYLGASHIPRTAIIGLVFGLIVVAAGSLWPAIVLHAAIDLNSGWLGYQGFKAAAKEPAGGCETG